MLCGSFETRMNMAQTNLNEPRIRMVGRVIAAIFIVAFVVVGCQQKDSNKQAKDAALQDPLLRQQLTSMLSDLHSDRAVPKAIEDLDAILSVNSAKLSSEQSLKLRSAKNKLSEMGSARSKLELAMLKMNDNTAVAEGNPFYRDYLKLFQDDYLTLFREAKQLITEVAATF
jgi:hypothetical protein